MSNYTLQDYFTAAKLVYPVSFAPYVNLKFPPWDHQITGLKKLLQSGDFGLYDDPATGKTLIAQAYSLFWVSEGERTLWLMPPSLLGQWEESFHENFEGIGKYVQIETYNGTVAQKTRQKKRWAADGGPQILAMGYELFVRGGWKIAKEGGYRTVVVDEAHKIKNPESKVFNTLYEEILRRGRNSIVVPMTGTPVHRELKDTYTLIKLTNPTAYKSFDSFDKKHLLYKKIRLKTPKVTKRGRRISQVRVHYGYQGKEAIRKALYKNARRVTRAQVTEIKDPQIVEVPVNLAPAHLHLYKKLVRERILELDEGEIITALTDQELRQKLLQIVTCPELFLPEDKKVDNAIVSATRDLIDGCGIDKTKVILFLHFRSTVQAFAEHFKEYNPALMYGGSNTEKNRKKFHTDDSCRMLIANVKSAGEGHNFQHLCHTIIYPEPVAVPGDFKQSMERVVRHGQKNDVTVYILKALKTVAPRATDVMRGRQKEVNFINRDKSSFLDYFQAT